MCKKRNIQKIITWFFNIKEKIQLWIFNYKIFCDYIIVDNDFKICVKLSDDEIIEIIYWRKKEPKKISNSEWDSGSDVEIITFLLTHPNEESVMKLILWKHLLIWNHQKTKNWIVSLKSIEMKKKNHKHFYHYISIYNISKTFFFNLLRLICFNSFNFRH